MSDKRAFADLVAAACQQPGKQLQPPTSFYEEPSDQRKAAEYLRAQMLSAKRYILDDDVVAAAVDLGMQHPEIVLAVLKNALAPFDTMWIEWSPEAQLQASMSNTGIPEGYHASGGKPAGNVGVLLKRVSDTGYRITMIGECLIETAGNEGAISSTAQYGPSPLAIYYDIHAPVYGGQLSYAEQIVERNTQWTGELLRAALLAGAYSMNFDDSDVDAYLEENGLEAPEGLSPNNPGHPFFMEMASRKQTRMRQCDLLSSHAQWVFDPVFAKPFVQRIKSGPDPLDPTSFRSRYHQHATETLGLQIQEEAGVFRFVISVIALMIGRDRIASETVIPREKGKSRFKGGRMIPFLENRRVSLTVPRKIANKRILRALSRHMPCAEHDVEGHWKQRRKGYDFTCDHVMVWETPKREICAIEGCGFKRWRVDEFKRGDPNIGVIKKTRVAELDRKVKPIPAVSAEAYGD